ncbi:MAG: SpaA isopeptide-forming pilin-related protein, partial [Butyrivibrio hungatei]|nr:SpaA isopeptide-forming pilin-related protein [Butyrivibrio hungatei]
GKELAKAELSLTSLDGFDMSGVTVTQGNDTITPRLSADKKTIAFDTVDTSPSVVKGLRSGQYELKETVTPEAYLTADAIRFTLRFDGSIDCSGQITVAGSPVIMVDKADPSYKQKNNPPIPATGETVSLSTMMGFAVLSLALGLTGYGAYRIKKKKN